MCSPSFQVKEQTQKESFTYNDRILFQASLGPHRGYANLVLAVLPVMIKEATSPWECVPAVIMISVLCAYHGLSL